MATRYSFAPAALLLVVGTQALAQDEEMPAAVHSILTDKHAFAFGLADQKVDATIRATVDPEMQETLADERRTAHPGRREAEHREPEPDGEEDGVRGEDDGSLRDPRVPVRALEDVEEAVGALEVADEKARCVPRISMKIRL